MVSEQISILEHPQLGQLCIVTNVRARRFTFRATDDGLRVTVPRRWSKKDLLRCVDEMLPKLLALREKAIKKAGENEIRPGFTIETDSFFAQVVVGRVNRPAARLKEGKLVITCPERCEGNPYGGKELQVWLVRVIEDSLRFVCKQVLPMRMEELAKQYGFTYSDLKIHKTHGRWGSCSARRNINLSLYLLLLPRELQDYVMLHELCHTEQMNHGPLFWERLNEVSGGRAEFLRREMKRYDTSVFFHK